MINNWVFIVNPNHFRMKDFLEKYDFVEFTQRNKVHLNDIVYLYLTSPVKAIKYKMIVERTDIPNEETFEDSDYSLPDNPRKSQNTGLWLRLRLLDTNNNSDLSLEVLKSHGLRYSMQGNFKVSGELLDFIDSFFQ